MVRLTHRSLMVAALFAGLAARAEDWPQFRGPDGQGHSGERGLPLEWGESKNIRWKAPIPGRGWSSPVIQGDRIWLTTAVKLSLRAIALDRETGRIIHDVEVFRPFDGGELNPKNSYASPTPILEGDRVYVHYGANGTAALASSGEVIWKTTLPYQSQHGTGGSPVLYGDLLIVNCDGTDVQYSVGLDKRTGKIRWKTTRKSYMAYSTPLVIHAGDRDQVVSPGAYRAVSYDPLTGKEIWAVSYGDGFSNVPRPVYGHGLVFLCTGFQQAELLAVRPGGKVQWTAKRAISLTPSPLLVGDELYVVSDNGIATCFDARTGQVHWRERLEGSFSASPTYADGRIYFLNEDGESTVIQPGKEFHKLAVNKLEGPALASMAVSDGSIFLRSGSYLYRIAQ